MEKQASKKSVMIISLISNNSDTFKIYFVVMFVDMAGNLGVIYKEIALYCSES